MFYRKIENHASTNHYDDSPLNTKNNNEYRERIKMKLKQIIKDRDFKDFIRDAAKELMSEL